MIDLKDVPYYNELLKMKKENMKVKRKGIKYATIIMLICIILSFKYSLFPLILGIVVSVLLNVIMHESKMPEYERFYYEKFFPEFLKLNGIYDLKFEDKQRGSHLLESSGLSSLTGGAIQQVGCFKRKSNAFKYFGYYEKIKRQRTKNGNSSTTTFDGFFFIKKLYNKPEFNLEIIGFKASKPNAINKKGYFGRVLVNNEKIILSKQSIKLLKELEHEYGKMFVSLNDNYLAVQFFKYGSCQFNRLYPYLKHGKYTENHFKIIDLSNRSEKIDYIMNQVLEDVSKTHLK